MKVLRTLFATFLILIIIGGLGYIGYSVFFMGGMNHQGMNTAPNTAQNTTPGTAVPPGNTAAPNQNQQPANQHGGGHETTGGGSQNTAVLNTVAVQNRDRLSQAIGTINQAMDLITIDPYSKATVPSTNPNNMQQGTAQGQPGHGTGTINIYPGGNSSVNIAPNGNILPNNPASSANTNQGAVNMQQGQNFVYDQGKLQQIHNGIFTLAQGIMTINQLNDDLLAQSSMVEAVPANYQTYVARYNTALQNKTKLSNAMSLLSQASTLINVNPYASSNGYPYNTDAMAQLHQGVYKLAQGMVMLNRLNEDFTRQMAEASAQVQYIANAAYQNNNMNHGAMTGWGLFGNINMSTVFNLILIVMVVGLIAGILGAIFSIFRKSKPDPADNPDIL